MAAKKATKRQTKYRLGWRKDEFDPRDVKLAPHPHYIKVPVTAYDPRAKRPRTPWNQGNAGSCTAHGTGRVHHARIAIKMGIADDQLEKPARMANYNWTRDDQGTFDEDSGASVRGAMKSWDKRGIPHESTFPYDVKNNLYRQPPKACADDGKKHDVTPNMYARVPADLSTMRALLYSDHLITFGFPVPTSFMKVGKTGVWAGPQKGDKNEGGHCVTIVGFDDARKAFLIINSWGTGYGDKGYVWMPYSFVLTKGSDFWTVVDAPNY